MKKYILMSVLAVAFVNARAQEHGSNLFAVNYHMAIPSLDFKDNFIDYTSFRGFSVDYRHYMTDKLALGLNSGYQVFHHKYDRQTFYFDQGAATLVHWRYGHVVPILLETNYDLLESGGKLQLSVGLGMGPYYVREEAWVGIYTVQWEQWGFGLAPEAQLRFNINDHWGIMFAPRYQVVFGAERANLDDEKNNVGIWDFRFGLFFIN